MLQQEHYVRMGEQFLHDEVVVNFPSQLSPLFHRFQFLVTFNLQEMREQKQEEKELVECGITYYDFLHNL